MFIITIIIIIIIVTIRPEIATYVTIVADVIDRIVSIIVNV